MTQVPTAPHWCLFLDLDGTLVELADSPDAVVVDDDLLPLLARLHDACGGALALISGRTISDLDNLLGTARFPSAGTHGCQRRDASGEVHLSGAGDVSALRKRLGRLVAENPDLLLEDKGAGLAVHFQKSPHLACTVRAGIGTLPPGYEILEGRAVLEVKPACCTKGTAVTAFMHEAPFSQRTPIFIGDDASDLDGFTAVRRFHGLAIAVGPRVAADRWLAGPVAVRRYLASLLASPA